MRKFIVGLAVVASLAFAGSASAASPGYVTFYGSCDYSRHTMDVSTNLLFDVNRYSVGKSYPYRVKYAYIRVNTAGTAVSGWYYTGWRSSNAKPSIVPDYGGYRMDATNLDNYRIPVSWGRWWVYVWADVWTGSNWDSSGWQSTTPANNPRGYTYSGGFDRTGYWTGGNGPDCLVSLT